MDEKRMTEAYERFRLAYKKSAKRGKCLDLAGFANEYLCDRSTDKGKRRYLRKTLPHLSKEQREQYMDAVYCCRFCDKYFALWYVSKAEWEETGESFERVITSMATGLSIIPGDVYQPPCVDVVFDGENNCFEYIEVNEVLKTDHIGDAKHKRSWGLFICKECYENIFNPTPNYINIEEFERELPEGSWKSEPPQGYFDWKKSFLSVIWELPALKVSI